MTTLSSALAERHAITQMLREGASVSPILRVPLRHPSSETIIHSIAPILFLLPQSTINSYEISRFNGTDMGTHHFPKPKKAVD
jgi:hypothetical protein